MSEEIYQKVLSSNNTHTISVYVNNKPGVLVRVSQVFSRRGFNIDSLTVSPGMNDNFSRMTITAQGDPSTLEQIIRQVSKLIDVVHASEHSNQIVVQTELALVKVKSSIETRTEILQIVNHFKSVTVDFTDESIIAQVTGNTEKIDALVKMLAKYGILEIVRTGKLLMARGKEPT